MKELNKKTTQNRKPVQYRARHKKLRALREEDTKHGFRDRIKVERSQSQPSEKVFCGVWRGGDMESIELTTSNYRSAPTELEDNVRAGRSPVNGDTYSASNTAYTSPSSSTYSSDVALLEDFIYSPYHQPLVQLAPTHEILEQSPQDYYPTLVCSAVTGGHPLPTPEIQINHLRIEEDLNIVVSGYDDRYRDATYSDRWSSGVDSQVPMVTPNLTSYDYYSENQYLTQGSDVTSNQTAYYGWEPALTELNQTWNASEPLVERPSFYPQVNSSNTAQNYPSFEISTFNDYQYIPHPNSNQPNISTQDRYYSNPQ